MELVLRIGIPATGKSTFAREFFGTHVRLNRDMLKTHHRERVLFEACLSTSAALHRPGSRRWLPRSRLLLRVEGA